MSRWTLPIGIGPLCIVGVLLISGGEGGEGPPRTAGEDRGDRQPWTNSRVVGSPDPPRPYTVEVAFPSLTFDRPVELAFVPGAGRLAVAEQGGKVFTFPDDPGEAGPHSTDLTIDLKPLHDGFTNLYGLAFHPDFARNGRLFLCYTIGHNAEDGTRVSEFRVEGRDPLRTDPSSERVLITWYAGGHNGGSLKFGPEDGYLYISSGDGAEPTPPDPFLAGQDMGTLMSKVLRIDVDYQDPGLPYRIPPDNPFVDLPGARPEIWAYGFRNPWRMSFDREGGDLWLGDVGWELWELVHRVERGGNYGWSLMEGRQPVMPDGPRGPTPISLPVVDHPHSEAASVTGGFVSRGDRLKDLKGAYIYGDFQTGTIWGLRLDGREVTRREVLAETPLRLVAFGEDESGELFLVDYERSNQIYRLIPNPEADAPNRDFPRRLSETGLFDSVADLDPSPGVLRYQINTPFWSDGTGADRLMAVPGLDQIEWRKDGLWRFPDGSVFARTVLIDPDSPSPTKVETQLLHIEDGTWRPYTYRWNVEQTEATLVEAAGETATFLLDDGREITHRFAPRSECVLCHNPWAGEGLLYGRQSATPLTANTLQMNVAIDAGGRAIDQLRTFERIGLFLEPLPGSHEELPRLADPHDVSIDLDTRARSYLQVNCAQCHRLGAGGSAAMFLTADRAIEDMGILNAEPMQGSFGIPDARIVAPGDPFRSILPFRMAKFGAGRMPRVGPTEVDVRGVDLIQRWIAGLSADGQTGPPADPFEKLPPETAAAIALLCNGRGDEEVDRAAAFLAATDDARGAMALLRRIDEGAVADPIVEELVALSRSSPRVEVRDLFERLVPASERAERLGDAIDASALLTLEGDAERGRSLFLEGNVAQCRTCHRIAGEGVEVGPDLDAIGATYSKEELLHHIVAPSAKVEPPYVTYLVETVDGVLRTGMLVEQTDAVVLLQDSNGEAIRLDAAEVEAIAPTPQSLMPEGLLAPLTAREAADLLEFLARQARPFPEPR